MDNAYNLEVQKARFESGERTIHKDLIPAKDRIGFYKRKLPRDQNQSIGESSTRPTTKSSTNRVKTAQTRGETVYGQVYKPTFNTFYTNKGEVQYNNLLKVESKSSYLNYIPSDDIIEQKIEKMWKESQNKQITEKRCNEEIQQTMKEWGDAKSRYEEDHQRKSENMWFGSNFGVRAFIRKTKTKKFDIRKNHLVDSDGSSLLSESEIDQSDQLDSRKVEEDEGEGDGDDKHKNYKTQPKPAASKDQGISSNAYGSKVKAIINRQNVNKQRAHTAERSKRRAIMPRLIDTSREDGDKV